MKILSVVGARPNFMKIAPIIAVIKRYNQKNTDKSNFIHHVLVHTGQHYDKAMSDSFFDDLHLPNPDIHLGIGSASHAVQTAEIMRKFESVLLKEMPDIVVVVGDVNSTLACALVASKISYDSEGRRPLIAHIEAGLRSFDHSMPEEINRILTDHISDLLFVTEISGVENLQKEGISQSKVFLVGNTMIDTLHASRQMTRKSKILEKLGFVHKSPDPYVLLTLHRPSNVDNKSVFLNIIGALEIISKTFPVIFPCHPRTKENIKKFGFESYFNFLDKEDIFNKPLVNKEANFVKITKSINLLPPLSYLDCSCLMSNAKFVFTDSGGIQEETTYLGIPCITIRANSERPITVTQGTNVIAGMKKEGIIEAFAYQLRRKFKKSIPKYWDGKAAERILRIIIKLKIHVSSGDKM